MLIEPEMPSVILQKTIQVQNCIENIFLFEFRFDVKNFIILPTQENANTLVFFREKLLDFAHLHNFSNNDIFAVLTSSGEALANSIEHAFRKKKNGQIDVKLILNDKHIILKITDNGIWRKSKTINAQDRGRGIIIMKQLMSNYNMNSDEFGTTVNMELDLE